MSSPAAATAKGTPRERPAPYESAYPRRLQRMGTVTVGVTLPKSWVGERHLGPGDAVFLHTSRDGALVVRDGLGLRGSARVTIPVDPSRPSEHLFRQLVGAYLAGATEFALLEPGGVSRTTESIARTFARRTGHTEGITEEGGALVLRDVTMGSSPPTLQQIRRMFEVVRDLHADAATAWMPGRSAAADSWARRDDEADRLAWQIERSVRRQLAEGRDGDGPDGQPGDLLRFLLWARDLERIADHAVAIGEHGGGLALAAPPAWVGQLLGSYHAQAIDHLCRAHKAALEADAARSNEVLDLGEALHETQAALTDRAMSRVGSDRLPADALRSLGLILQSIDRTTAYAQNIAEIGLDRDLDRQTRPAPPPVAEPASRSSAETKRGGTRKA